jgi:hypothetical protein
MCDLSRSRIGRSKSGCCGPDTTEEEDIVVGSGVEIELEGADARSLFPIASGVRIPELISVSVIFGLPFRSSDDDSSGTGYKGRMPEKSTGDVSGGGSMGETP